LLALLGDSSAAGFGVDRPEETPGALIAAGLSEIADRPVRLLNAAKVGARSADLLGQVTAVGQHQPDIAVIMIGANDVTHRVRPVTSVRQLSEAVRVLRVAGAEIVVGTCPDLGTVEPIAQPLRLLARRWSRTLAAAQTIAVVEAGARSVSLADLLGPEFAAAPRELFSADRFHPSASGYARVASVVLPSVAAALSLGLREEDEKRPVLAPGEGVSSLAAAAAQAVEEPGTEVSGTEVGGRESGPWGRWVVLRHRIHRFTRRPAGPQPEQLVR
jgi:lysophospholipase L1-like esterase